MTTFALAGCGQGAGILAPDESADTNLGPVPQGDELGSPGGSLPTTTTATVGPAGATIVAGPATLVVPRGAVDEPMDVTLVAVDGETVTCDLHPGGSALERAATLTLATDDPLEKTIEVYDEATGSWVELGGVDVGGGLAVDLVMFSTYQTSLAVD